MHANYDMMFLGSGEIKADFASFVEEERDAVAGDPMPALRR